MMLFARYRTEAAEFDAAAWGRNLVGAGLQAVYRGVDDPFDYAAIGVVDDEAQIAPTALAHQFYLGPLVSDDGKPGNAHTAMQVVAFDVPPELTGEVDDWYRDEHIKLLMRGPGWWRARRMKVQDHRGARFTSVAIHELADLSVMESPERAAARDTPWRDRLAVHPWFAASGRWLYARLT